jgi:hypothetical protein
MSGLFLGTFTALTLSLPTTQKIEPLVGTWVAEHEGVVWIRLDLRAVGGSLAGQIALGNMEVDAQGRVSAAQRAPDRGVPIVDVAVGESTVRFVVREGSDTDRFALHLVDGNAELHFEFDEATRKELVEQGIPAPKPVRLRRSSR